jgi:CBS domain-containing membrane protein
MPHQERTGSRDVARMFLGALGGIFVVGIVTRAWLGPQEALPLLVAPMGASAVLLFAVPASPLAQPWPTIGGCVVSALAGVAASKVLGDRIVAAALGVAAATAAMAALRCLHPPGGAVALTAVVGGSGVVDAGWSFALIPVGVNALLLVAMALVINNLAGHSYPHVAVAHELPDALPPELRVTDADVEAALHEYGERLDVAREDITSIVDSAIAHAWDRARPEAGSRR